MVSFLAERDVMGVDPDGPTTVGYTSLTQTPQSKGNWCGPAAGMSILRMMYGSSARSKADGSLLAQASLASATHMNTGTSATHWDHGDFVRGLNKWDAGTFWKQTHAPTPATVANNVYYNILARNRTIAADTVEWAGGALYNGHPDPTKEARGHWISAQQFSSSGYTIRWADPATSVYLGAPVQPYFTAGTTSFTNTFLQSNGIAS